MRTGVNPHAVWDNCTIEKKIGLDYTDIAAKLRAEIKEEDRAHRTPSIIDTPAVVAWANKSSAIAKRLDVGAGRQVRSAIPGYSFALRRASW